MFKAPPTAVIQKNFLVFFSVVVFLGYCCFALIYHEPWRDEVHPWLMTGNASWSEIVHRSYLEIQSPVFMSLLKLLHFFGDSYLVYRIFLLLISIASFILIIQLKNVSIKFKVLLICNYYFLYEYLWIQRIYALQVFLAVVLVATFVHAKKQSQIQVNGYQSFSLLMYSSISMWGLITTIGLCMAFNASKKYQISKRMNFLWSISFIIQLSFLLLPRGRNWGVTSSTISKYLSLEGVEVATASIIHAFFVLPRKSINFWNTSFLEPSILLTLVVVLVCSFAVFWINRNFKFNLEFIPTVLTIFIIVFLSVFGKQRHLGQIPLVLVIFIAILPIFHTKKIPSRRSSALPWLLMFSFIVSGSYSTLVGAMYDWKHPFSTSYSASFPKEADSITILYDQGRPTYLPALVGNLDANVYQLMGNTNRHYFLFDDSSWKFDRNLAFRHLCESRQYLKIYLFSKKQTDPTVAQFFLSNRVDGEVSGIESSESGMVLQQFKSVGGISDFCLRKNFDEVIDFIFREAPGYSE